MGVTMHPAEVKAVGTKAEGVSTDDVVVALGKLKAGELAKAFAGLKGFESDSALDNLFGDWTEKTKGFAICIEAVGGKLKSSANTYLETDNSSGDLFEVKDAYAETR